MERSGKPLSIDKEKLLAAVAKEGQLTVDQMVRTKSIYETAQTVKKLKRQLFQPLAQLRKSEPSTTRQQLSFHKISVTEYVNALRFRV